MENVIKALASRGLNIVEITEKNDQHTFFTAKRKRGVQHFRYTAPGELLKRNGRGLYEPAATIRPDGSAKWYA